MKTLYPLAAVIAVLCCSFYTDKTITRKTKPTRQILKSMPADTTEALPRSYKNRKFLNDVSGISFDCSKIPGNIVSFNSKDSSYQFRTMKGIVKGDKPASSSVINDGSLYKAIITSKTSFNGSYLIGGLSVGPNEVMELSIRDEVVYTVPDSLVDVDAIKSATKDIPADDRKNLYYIKAATLTSITSKKYTLAKFNPAVNAFYLTLDGKVYSTKEKPVADRLVSMWLVPIQRLFEAPGNK
ncbi:MAG: hypothetical protein ACXVIY_07395 [Mucilaginibacter sp.]